MKNPDFNLNERVTVLLPGGTKRTAKVVRVFRERMEELIHGKFVFMEDHYAYWYKVELVDGSTYKGSVRVHEWLEEKSQLKKLKELK